MSTKLLRYRDIPWSEIRACLHSPFDGDDFGREWEKHRGQTIQVEAEPDHRDYGQVFRCNGPFYFEVGRKSYEHEPSGKTGDAAVCVHMVEPV